MQIPGTSLLSFSSLFFPAMRFALCLFWALSLHADEARDIVAKALARDEKNLDLLNTYTYEKRTIVKHLQKDGSAKSTEERLSEVIHIDGTEVERLIAKEGKPLSAQEAEEQQKKIDKEIDKIKRESPKERAKRRGETEKDRQEEREARREVLEAYDFSLVATESLHDRQCWKIAGRPKSGWKGKGRRANQFKALQGHLWIDQDTYEWVRMDLDSTDTISFGWFLFRLQPGARIRIDQTLVNNEVWLPKQVDLRAEARLLGKMLRLDVQSEYRNFRKFTTDSQLIVGEPAGK